MQALGQGLSPPHRDTVVGLVGALGLSPDEPGVCRSAAMPSPVGVRRLS
jgi:hypothetical protein